MEADDAHGPTDIGIKLGMPTSHLSHTYNEVLEDIPEFCLLTSHRPRIVFLHVSEEPRDLGAVEQWEKQRERGKTHHTLNYIVHFVLMF